MREKIACFTCGNKDICYDHNPRREARISSSLCFMELQKAEQILSLIREEIEKVENPYPHFHGESLVYGSSSEAFEECHQDILALLKNEKTTQEIINPDNSEKGSPKTGVQNTGV